MLLVHLGGDMYAQTLRVKAENRKYQNKETSFFWNMTSTLKPT